MDLSYTIKSYEKMIEIPQIFSFFSLTEKFFIETYLLFDQILLFKSLLELIIIVFGTFLKFYNQDY